MEEKPRIVANLDDDETAEQAAVSGPLGRLVEGEIDSGTVESDDSPRKSITPVTPGQPSIRSTEYAEGTTEHDDDREE